MECYKHILSIYHAAVLLQYDATELYSTIKQLGAFIKAQWTRIASQGISIHQRHCQGRRKVGAVVVDSIAFSFRHEARQHHWIRTLML